MSDNSYSKDKFSVLEERYFGENPPGLILKFFAPEIVPTKRLFEDGRFSPGMKEFYFSRKKGNMKNAHFLLFDMEIIVWGSNLRPT